MTLVSSRLLDDWRGSELTGVSLHMIPRALVA
jgi:hypothetical protein